MMNLHRSGLPTEHGTPFADFATGGGAVRIRNPKSQPVRGRFSPFGSASAFTLIEVMIATTIFFISVFAIMGLVTNSLRNAQVLQQHTVDTGMLAAMTVLTNRLFEGTESGDFEDIAPGSYPGYSWTRDVYQVASNGLFRVDLTVSHSVKGRDVDTKMSILLYRPMSPPGKGFGGVGGGFGP